MAKLNKAKVVEKKVVEKDENSTATAVAKGEVKSAPIVKDPPVKVDKVAATTAGAGFISDKKVIEFEGAEVIAILEQNEKEKLCRMSDGTTKWVRNEFFQDQPDEN